MDWLCINISPSSGNNILRFSGCHRSVVECWQPRWLFTFVFMISWNIESGIDVWTLKKRCTLVSRAEVQQT